MTSAATSRRNNPAPAYRLISTIEFDLLWEWLGLGATPVVLRLTSPGRTHSERREIATLGWRGLRDRGLADLNGPDPEIVRLMRRLAAPTRQVELRMRRGGELRMVAAGSTGAAALAVRTDNTVALCAVSSAIPAVLDALPPMPAGAGRSVTLPTADLTSARQAEERGCPLVEGLIDRGVSPTDAELIDTILGGALGQGQISVLAADSWGVPHRLRRVLGVLDSRHGRYLVLRDPAADGAEWTTLVPTDRRRMLHRMNELLDEAVARADRM